MPKRWYNKSNATRAKRLDKRRQARRMAKIDRVGKVLDGQSFFHENRSMDRSQIAAWMLKL